MIDQALARRLRQAEGMGPEYARSVRDFMNRDPQPENRDPEPQHGNPEHKAQVFTRTCENDRCGRKFETLNPRTRRCPICELNIRCR